MKKNRNRGNKQTPQNKAAKPTTTAKIEVVETPEEKATHPVVALHSILTVNDDALNAILEGQPDEFRDDVLLAYEATIEEINNMEIEVPVKGFGSVDENTMAVILRSCQVISEGLTEETEEEEDTE